MSPEIILALIELHELARPSVDYCRAHGINFSSSVPICGGVFLAPIRLVAPNHFEPDPEGTLAAYCEVFDEDAETTIDVVAWSLTDPRKVRVMFGRAPALGLNAAVNPATYFPDNRPLHLYRTPLTWLQNGGNGAVILDPVWGARWLLDLPTDRLAPEDDGHASALHHARKALFNRQRLLVPTQQIRRAA